MQLRHAANTDTGRARDHNEDTFAIEAEPEHVERGALFVVCDGMGGFAAGEVASDLAATTIRARYYAISDADPGSALRSAFADANARIFSRGQGKMGTTSVAALFLDDVVLLANVGDSRAYLIREGAIRQLTQDHSFVAEQVSAGVLTADQARESSYRNIITRALGHRPDVEVDLYQEVARPRDRVLLCSDGLHGLLEPEEIAELAGAAPLQDAVDTLIAVANERGGPDNITAVLIEVVVTTAGSGAAASTERLVTASPPAGSTARLPGSAAHVRVDPSARLARPVQLRQSAPPLAAPMPRRGPILGLILMTLVGLALLGGVVWFVLAGGLGELSPAPTPVVPPLTPLKSSTVTPAAGTQTPTFVPTLVPQRTAVP